jgi:hypothetical protein
MNLTSTEGLTFNSTIESETKRFIDGPMLANVGQFCSLMLDVETEGWIDHELDFSRKSVVVTKNSPEGTVTDVHFKHRILLQQKPGRSEIFKSSRSLEGEVNSFVH